MTIDGATVTAVTGVLVGAVGLVIGQAESISATSAPAWLTTAGGITSLGFAMWYCYYNEAYARPAREKAYAEERAARDKMHSETIAELVKEFRVEAKEQRQQHTLAVEKIDSSMDRLSSVIERAIQSK